MALALQLLLFAAVNAGYGYLQNKHPPLVRLDPVRKGHQEVLELPGLEKHSLMTTVQAEPPIFLIDDFLTSDECTHIIGLAKQQGLGTSQTGDELEYLDPEIREEFDVKGAWEDWNSNGDDWLDRHELRENMMAISNAKFSDSDVDQMFMELNLDVDGDGQLSFEEFAKSDPVAVNEFVLRVRDANPWYKVRYSSQAWLSQDAKSDPVLQRLRERLIALTHLPRLIVETSEQMQVVHYTVGGHYHCHLDTDPEQHNATCCHFTHMSDNSCRLCRYLTLLYFLNEVPEGGATAFPSAHMEGDLNYDDFQATGLCNLSAQCEAGIVVKPKMGSAVLWYSHFLDDEGQLGKVDNKTMHGGCDVIKGEKWIANNWIDIDGFIDYSEIEKQEHDIGDFHSEL